MNHLHFKTPDPKRTAQWYVDNPGAKVVSEVGTTGYRLDLHGVPLNVTGFVEGQKLEQHYGREHVAIDPDDLTGTVERLVASGARILEEREASAWRSWRR